MSLKLKYYISDVIKEKWNVESFKTGNVGKDSQRCLCEMIESFESL